MSKIALLVLGGSVFFGLLKLVTSDEPAGEIESRASEHVVENNEQQERFGSQANSYAASMNRPGPYPPIPNPTPYPGNLVECYVCTDCPRILPNTTSKLCPYTLSPDKQSKCVVYAEQYKHMKRPWYIRGCASERGSCADIRTAHSSHADIVTLLMCSECEGERCNVNGASRSITDITMSFFVLVVTPLIGKYTLS